MKRLSITIYKAKDGYRWRMKRGADVVAESGEGYKRLIDLRTTLNNLIESIQTRLYKIENKY